MKQGLLSLANSFLHLIYPATCIHCNTLMRSDAAILCESCLLLMELINPNTRCPLCFSESQNDCQECKNIPSLFIGMAAAFDYVGPPATLIKRLKYGDQPFLAKGCSGFLAAQFLQSDWPMPDVIIPVPISFTRKLARGYNQSLLLAQELSLILNVPLQASIKRKSGDYSQAGLSRQQRLALDGKNFCLKPNQNLKNKTILLVDDVMTTGSTLLRCAETLIEEQPGKMYALTFCRALSQ